VGIGGFEQRLERGVEGFFGRVFKSGLRPVELGRKLVREMDLRRTVGVNGRTLAPNSFTFVLAESDSEQLADMVVQLRRELADAAREHARDEQYRFVGPIEVVFEIDEGQRAGLFQLEARFVGTEEGAGIGTLVLPDGDRVPLGDYVVSIGRSPECTIVVGDSNVSRHHAEIRPAGEGFVLVDLASTNGTKVNQSRIGEHQLADGDIVQFGNVVVRFEAS